MGRHWKALVTKDWGRMKGLVIQFACATTTLAVLNATLKYYISTLREQVGERVTHTHGQVGERVTHTRAGDAHTTRARDADTQVAAPAEKEDATPPFFCPKKSPQK